MGRGNLFMGYATGKVGSVVYSVSHGQQRVRAYNPQKYDAMSDSQIIRRAHFATSSKFYARGLRNAFKYAFENRYKNETEQNVFLRVNSSYSIMSTPDMLSNPLVPALGQYTISVGTIPAPKCIVNSRHLDMQFQIPNGVNLTPEYELFTIAQFTNAMLMLGYKVGDIFTYTEFKTDSTAGTTSSPINVGTQEPQWIAKQFTLDPTSQVTLQNIGFYAAIVDDTIMLETIYDLPLSYIAGMAFQISRKVRGQIKVTTSRMYLNSQGQLAMQYASSAEWQQIVLDAWKARAGAVLSGSISQNAINTADVSINLDFTTPISTTSLVGKTITTNYIVNAEDMMSHLQVSSSDGQQMSVRAMIYENNVPGFTIIRNGQTFCIFKRQTTNQYVWECTQAPSTTQIGAISWM